MLRSLRVFYFDFFPHAGWGARHSVGESAQQGTQHSPLTCFLGLHFLIKPVQKLSMMAWD